MEAELDERLLLVHVKLPENLGGIQKMRVVNDLLDIPAEKGQVKDEWQPVSVDQEDKRQESMYGGFGDYVGVEAVAEIDRGDVVAFQVAVHDGEKDLQEQVDGIHQYRKEV